MIISYPFKEIPLRRHELNAVQTDLVEVSLGVVDVLRHSSKKAAGVPSSVFAEKAHFVQPPVGLRRALMYFPRPATPDW